MIYYASKTLNIAQLNYTTTKKELHYTTTKKELHAVIFACEKFKSYLVGLAIVVFSDKITPTWLIMIKFNDTTYLIVENASSKYLIRTIFE